MITLNYRRNLSLASVSCVRVVTEVVVYANNQRYTEIEGEDSVKTPIKESMEGSLLSQFVLCTTVLMQNCEMQDRYHQG